MNFELDPKEVDVEDRKFSDLCNGEGICYWISGLIMLAASLMGVVTVAFSCVFLKLLFWGV